MTAAPFLQTLELTSIQQLALQLRMPSKPRRATLVRPRMVAMMLREQLQTQLVVLVMVTAQGTATATMLPARRKRLWVATWRSTSAPRLAALVQAMYLTLHLE